MRKPSCPTCSERHVRCDHDTIHHTKTVNGKIIAVPFRPFDDPRNNFTIKKEKGEKRDLLTSPIRVGVIDIETTGLDASFGRVLCGVTMLFSPDETLIRRADEYDDWDSGRRSSDKGLVEAILLDLEKCDIVIGHNATYFDLPFLRTRALIHGLNPVHPKKIFDPVLLARKVFRFHSNSLDSISNVLGTGDVKTKLAPRVWVKAMFDGDIEALDEVVNHCILDVKVLTEIADKMSPYIRQLDSLGSWRA